jgi:hypothetical protein
LVAKIGPRKIPKVGYDAAAIARRSLFVSTRHTAARSVMGLVALSFLASPAPAADLEISGMVGIHSPIYQDDASDDSLLGGRVRLPVAPGFKVEVAGVYFDMDSGPYRVRGVPQEVQTWSMTGLTAAVTFGERFGFSGVSPFATVGSGLYFIRKNERPDTEEFGIFGSLGINFPLREEISGDIAGTITRVDIEKGGSRGVVSGHIAINYHLGLD